ncbi:MAG: squalene/phytoene synthase family protein [Gemmatimonadetes bacterium]|nr:squalene/phytoene synthase family protein [Gemmatimonadota bacterium]
MPTLEEVLRATSRTFAIGIEGLPRPLRDEMRIAYLILRVSDYLEDNTTLHPEEKGGLLDSWAQVLEGSPPPRELLEHLGSTRDPSPDAMAAHHASAIIHALQGLSTPAQQAIRKHTRDSTLGMARWVRRGPVIHDESDLDDYMHEVAGRVGYLITDLFARVSPRVAGEQEEMTALGREFGLALQTVNIVRGIPSDIQRGWFFVPRDLLPESVHSGEAFLAEANQDLALRTLDHLLDKASRHFEAAERYITLLPRFQAKMRYFCLLPFFFGVRTVALSRGNQDVLISEVKLDRAEVRSIAAQSKLWGWSNRWIRRYGRDLGR